MSISEDEINALIDKIQDANNNDKEEESSENESESESKTISTPVLKPSLTGAWNYDFTTPVTGDITIEWKE